MRKEKPKNQSVANKAKPLVGQHAREIQPYGMVVKLPIALRTRRSTRANLVFASCS